MKLFFLKKYCYGIRFFLFNKEFLFLNKKYVNFHNNIQQSYDLSILKKSDTIVLFVIPPEPIINGGILSIFSICYNTRKILPNACSVIVTFPGKLSYSQNKYFTNNEQIYNWNQIISSISAEQKIIIHIPEYLSDKFYQSLSEKNIIKLKNCSKLYINILNQNMKLMPTQKKLQSLYSLSKNISQTISHDRVMASSIYSNWTLPTYFLSVYIDISMYKKSSFSERDKIIAYSMDKNKNKIKIISKLQKNFPDFHFIEIKNMKFEKYIDIILKAYFTISFGEGFDSYFCQPYLLGGIGFSVYNDDFFPNPGWKKFPSVFNNYADMEKNIVSVMNGLLSENPYNTLANRINKEIQKIYKKEILLTNLTNFYNKLQ